MKNFRKSSGVLIIILAALSVFALPYQDIAYGADGYRFDDLAGPSGKSYQWMVVNGLGSGANTFGANHDVSMQVSADLLESNQEEGIYILNGTPDDSIVENRELSTLFLVVADGTGEFKFQFRSPTDINQTMAEAVGGDINLGSDTGAANARYHTEKEAYSAHLDSTGHYWLDYTFNIETQQGGHSTYDTVKQYFNFIQDASDTSSQTKHMPVVIANVNMESAIEEALELRMTLRDSNTNG
ncbi:MAG: hypothetical protein IJR35_09810, partial [Synergistaceae bacterium]|nr:hypothetical protein [Synergistaceae bacterium]